MPSVRPRPRAALHDQPRPARLRVRARPGERCGGVLLFRNRMILVALGRGGILANKREGDGATPRGSFRLVRVWWRPDRGPRPQTLLPARRIRREDAWCEDPCDRRYNRPFCLRPREGGDRLAREDSLYDLVIEIDHNTRPRVAGRGSAVFVHIARPGLAPTAGCVAMDAAQLRRLLQHLDPKMRIDIQ